MKELPKKAPDEMPESVVLEKPGFVPRMVMTKEIQVVAQQVIHQWRIWGRFAPLLKYGIRPLDRLLFHGPPGNGKTMACSWIARELNIPVYRILCNHLHGMYLGQTTKAVAEVMDWFGAFETPAVCLWDEVEAIFIDRKHAGQSGGSREVGTATTMFMQAIDRWRAPVLQVLATNLVESLDPAILSRMEMRLKFPGPTAEQCEQLLQYWIELLCDHGGPEWGPVIGEKIQAQLPVSFRELQQMIAFSAREWTARRVS